MPPLRRRHLVGLAVACAATAITGPAAGQSRPILVFAAASLKNALDAIAADWRKETGKQVAISYAASPTLAKQIESGAPADLFISADLDWMDYLQQHKLIDPKTRRDLLGNKLVLIAPKDSAAQATIVPGFPLARLLGGGRLAMADPGSVPAGKYGKAALTGLGVWQDVDGRVAAAENVRATLLLVARGEAPLGLVYQSDAAAEPSVKIVGAFPADTHPPITYPIALTLSARAGAAEFAAYLRSAAAATRFEAQGFTVLDRER
jgi:molybdate transport system substrate-binding protein